MAEPGIDELLKLTDSKYKLTVAIAKRAQQLLRYNFSNTVLAPPERPRMHTIEGELPDPNPVTWAMRELLSGRLVIGENLVPEDKLSRAMEETYRQELEVE